MKRLRPCERMSQNSAVPPATSDWNKDRMAAALLDEPVNAVRSALVIR